MKTMLVLWAAFLLVGGLIAPARAQGDKVTVTFEITEASTPCPNATYFAAIGGVGTEFGSRQLTDADNDGVYTGSVELDVGQQLAVQLLQGIGVEEFIGPSGPVPGDPSATIKDVGLTPITQDTVFSAQATGCSAGLPNAGSNGNLPVVPLTGAALLLAAGVCLRRRTWLRA